MKSILIILLFPLVIFTSCQEGRVFDSIADIEESKWSDSATLSFPFTVEDPAQLYDIFYSIRYTNDFPFYNLYVSHVLCDSTGKELSKHLKGMDIFWSKTGEPKGGGFAGTYDFDVLAFKEFRFPYKGKFTIKIKQYMRQSSLEGISAFGIRIDQHKK